MFCLLLSVCMCVYVGCLLPFDKRNKDMHNLKLLCTAFKMLQLKSNSGHIQYLLVSEVAGLSASTAARRTH